MVVRSGYDESELLLDLLGQDYDNFGEPTPLPNRPEVLRGFTITFLVRLPADAHFVRKTKPQLLFLTLVGFPDIIMAFCWLSVVCEGQDLAMRRLG